jgi:hypothetical protein
MLNSQDAEMLDALGGDQIPERGFANKKPGWYSFNIEEVVMRDNTFDPENPYSELNCKLKVMNGPAKGVEFLTLAVPPLDHPDMHEIVRDPDGDPVKDADGNDQPALDTAGNFVPNGNWKRIAGRYQDVMFAVFVGDKVKGRNDEAKARRKVIVKEQVEAVGAIADALVGRKIIAKLYEDNGQRADKDTGEVKVYNQKLKDKPRMKFSSFMSFDEAREKKYVLSDLNMNPPATRKVVAPSVSLDL